MFYQTQTTRRPPNGLIKCRFLSLVTLTFDIQTRPSEGPNISSVNLVQIFSAVPLRYFIHKQKNTD